jgi:hypothetical protein
MTRARSSLGGALCVQTVAFSCTLSLVLAAPGHSRSLVTTLPVSVLRWTSPRQMPARRHHSPIACGGGEELSLMSQGKSASSEQVAAIASWWHDTGLARLGFTAQREGASR